ncbi:hypothetical protein FB45DRAFT_314686 [Roridomyces roridus]|uniref:Uncharacterized protein n=1 Tax=Roridomyces roridus TaxID=1738132 RepID=A0AAD7B6W8_9AGAR|nr:hypothetical protein FB45DRAFT_314686 [Roridomyces roridus]
MPDCPPTPIVRRKAPTLTMPTRPYTRFIAECGVTDDDDATNQTPTHSDYLSFSHSLTPTIGTPIASDIDASFSFSQPPARKMHSFPPIATRPLEIIEESDLEERSSSPEDDMSSYSPTSSPSPTDRRVLSSPSTAPRWTSNYRMVNIEESDMEEEEIDGDDDDVYPPVSSSPGRSSSPLFPHRDSDASSSPQTSPDAYDANAPLKDADVVHSEPEEEEFGSELIRRLDIVAHQRVQTVTTEEGSPPATRSLAVTPDYIISPRPGFSSRNNFGPRSYSWSSTSTSEYGPNHVDFTWTRSNSFASHSSYGGYAADLDSSPNTSAHIASSSTQLSRSHSRTPTQSFVTGKRSYSFVREDPSPTKDHKKLKLSSRLSSFASRASTRASSHNAAAKLSQVPASLRKSRSLQPDATPSKDIPTSPYPIALFDVPIIAPPPNHVARRPLTSEESAKIRISRLLVREARLRAAEKLKVFADDITLSVENAIREVDMEMEEIESDEEWRRELERLKWEVALGLGPELRVEVVEWLLEVLPKKSFYARWKKHDPERYFGNPPGLTDQLLTSPETRFHAAYSFLRYFYLYMGDDERRREMEERQASDAEAANQVPFDPSIPPEGWDLTAWDACLACLDISVKLHRDTLAPLYPVYLDEIIALAPHKCLEDDLEIGVRDALSVFNYSLGGTPQPIMDELWLALPALRQLLDFSDGWKHTQKEAWHRFFEAVAEPDILKFRISLLTAAVLAEALMAALVFKYKYDKSVNGVVIGRRGGRRATQLSEADVWKLEQRAEREIEGVVLDMKDVMGITDEELEGCRCWVRAASKY